MNERGLILSLTLDAQAWSIY